MLRPVSSSIIIIIIIVYSINFFFHYCYHCLLLFHYPVSPLRIACFCSASQPALDEPVPGAPADNACTLAFGKPDLCTVGQDRRPFPTVYVLSPDPFTNPNPTLFAGGPTHAVLPGKRSRCSLFLRSGRHNGFFFSAAVLGVCRYGWCS